MVPKQAKQPGAAKSTNKIILTEGEWLLLHRKYFVKNQIEMAKTLHINLHAYKLLEYDLISATIVQPSINYYDITTPRQLLPHETCLILRKRLNKSQAEIASEMGISRTWLRAQETGRISCDKLLAHLSK